MAAKLQATAQKKATKALTSPAFGRLMIDLHEWLALRRWREQPVSETSARLFQPATLVVEARLRHLEVLLGRVEVGHVADVRAEEHFAASVRARSRALSITWSRGTA